jgi:hypothetical protein
MDLFFIKPDRLQVIQESITFAPQKFLTLSIKGNIEQNQLCKQEKQFNTQQD